MSEPLNSEQFNIQGTCYFCDTRLEGVALSFDAVVHLAVQADKALKEEVNQKPIGYACSHCGTCFCREHFGQLKHHWLHGVDKTPCPNCGQPLKDHLVIRAMPSAGYRALIDREIDKVLDSRSLGEWLKDGVREFRDDMRDAAEKVEIAKFQGTYARRDGREIEPPGRAPLLDFWPGRCTSCGEKTDEPITYVVYSCRQKSQKVSDSGLVKEYKVTYYDWREHPVRRCRACERKSDRLLGLTYDPHKKAKERIKEARAEQLKVSEFDIRVMDTMGEE